ncbi:4fe-4S ferredoxin, iron-sulfur binding protein, putative [Heliomicrobium modesticaldum Ice1]|uniref:4fe-4S ferredoxin, iron-sulfur binding protein, putative n=1 Tax=Heliobacterium modesticaldum (strain ATCC 51547 / Ice1) TaxID=498761 RepID=B0TG72_HELMI|nr:4Fe-4S dicluster domain-containing protein [Heliomicrobium modesticaldum]ABZ84568.1 4fe-4S ferredoxin, iron-sulfur binding protein, putative [Heliomicrobium modesticaldum Ice1]
MLKAFPKDKVTAVLDTLAKQATLWVPAIVAGVSRFAPYSPGREVQLGANTVMSPKEALFPATEKIYEYSAYGIDGEFTPVDPSVGPQILFGLRSCDMQGILCLDDVFLTHGYVDDYYAKKREEATIVTLGCVTPGPDCFCYAMGVNPAEHTASDAQLFDLGDAYGIVARTAKGEALVSALAAAGLLCESDKAPLPIGDFVLKVDAKGITGKLQQMFDHPLWDALSRKCLNCGACAYICPTCHCFDISDKKRNAHCGVKIKCWDTCMYSEYALMAGGHNPRPSKKERVRQRFMHKLRYFPERYGKLQCTGCGRCIAKCPVNLEITDVIQQVREAKIDG